MPVNTTFRNIPRLVMFETGRQVSASSLSATILRISFRYATFLGFVCFGIESNRTDFCLVARHRYWYKWFCLLSRTLICGIYGYVAIDYIFNLADPHLIILSWIRMVSSLICALVIMIMQFWFGQRVIRVLNSYFRLFGKVNALPGVRDGGFGGKREFTLLLFKLFCMLNEILCKLPQFFTALNFQLFITMLCDIYVSWSAAMIGHICFVGYLSVGALYAQVNHYVRHELRHQLRRLEQHGCQVSRGELNTASYRLEGCLDIYNEIQRVGSAFHRLMQVPLCLILLFDFLGMALVSYFIMLQGFRDVGMWFLVVRLFIDVVLLTLAIYGAASSSRVVRRLSLESCFVSERNDWHMKLEMFLNRLNFYEFRVCPLGLFEVSNELILVFLSGLVTYLTYILQYGMQSNQI